MKTSTPGTDAATSTILARWNAKTKVNIRSNANIHFLLGFILTVLLVWLIMEYQSTTIQPLNTVAITTKPRPVEIESKTYEVIPNEPVKVVVEPQVDISKKAVIVKNSTVTKPLLKLDPIQPVIAAVTTTTAPAATAPTLNNTDTGASNKKAVPTGPTSVYGLNEMPLYPGCSARLSNNERISCLSEKLSLFVQRNFDTGLARDLNLKGSLKIQVVFTIGSDGLIKDAQVKAPHPSLEKEARRVIAKFPQITPGKVDNAPVDASFALPIVFNVREF